MKIKIFIIFALALSLFYNPVFEALALSPLSQYPSGKDENKGFLYNPFLLDKIVRKIESSPQKRMTFYDFMNEALYSDSGEKEKGFFTGKADIALSGDFDTFANYDTFGSLVAKQIIEMWKLMGSPKKFSIVEMGAGRGKLCIHILNSIRRNNGALYRALTYHIVEISSKLIEEQKQEVLPHFKGIKKASVEWIHASATSGLALKDREGVVLSNEMIDNFLIHRIQKMDGKFYEVYVTHENGKLRDILGELSSPELSRYCEELQEPIPEGAEITVNLDIRPWQKSSAEILKRGFVITVDYGHDNYQDILKIQRGGYAVWNVETHDVREMYARVGQCDITYYVNFQDIMRAGNTYGLSTEGFILQKNFLKNLGMNTGELNPFSEEVLKNTEFKVLIQSKGMQALKTRLTGLQGVQKEKDKAVVFRNNLRFLFLNLAELKRRVAANRYFGISSLYKKVFDSLNRVEREYPTLYSSLVTLMRTLETSLKQKDRERTVTLLEVIFRILEQQSGIVFEDLEGRKSKERAA